MPGEAIPNPLTAFTIPNPLSGLGDTAETLAAARAWVGTRHNWVRVGWVLAGGLLFAVGLARLTGVDGAAAGVVGRVARG